MPRARKQTPVTEVVTSTEAFIVNKAGAVHSVNPADVESLLKRPGYRLATEGEIVAYKSTSVQDGVDPIGKRGL